MFVKYILTFAFFGCFITIFRIILNQSWGKYRTPWSLVKALPWTQGGCTADDHVTRDCILNQNHCEKFSESGSSALYKMQKKRTDFLTLVWLQCWAICSWIDITRWLLLLANSAKCLQHVNCRNTRVLCASRLPQIQGLAQYFHSLEPGLWEIKNPMHLLSLALRDVCGLIRQWDYIMSADSRRAHVVFQFFSTWKITEG